MMRTTFNIMNLGAKEISSSNALLRQIGYRRMIGAYTVLGGAGTAAVNIASELSGVTMEELQAYKNSFAADWNKNSILLPIDKWKKGQGKAINFSYFSPYDVVQKPFEAFMKAIHDGKTRTNQDWDDITMNAFAEAGGEIVSSFVSEPLGYERIIDVLPRGFFGRGGQKKAGGAVYSEDTDSIGDKMYKSFAHFLEGIEPGILTTGKKVAGAIDQDLKPGGQPLNLRDEALALFSGIRIINVDVPRSFNYKMTDFRRKKLSVTTAEKFYNLENAVDRGGDQYVKEFEDIQEEMFKVQQEFYNVLKDASALGLTKQDIRKLMKRRDFSNREINTLFRGKFTPFKVSESLMQKRLRDLKKAYPDEIINKDFFYPRKDFNRVMRKYRNKSLKVKQPEEDETSIFNKITDAIIPPAGAAEINQPIINTNRRVETPPLPATSMPNRQMTALPSLQKSPVTGLTRTESALLSPDEQVIARRT